MIIIRALIILLAFAFVVYVLKSIARIGFSLRRAMKDLRQLREEVNGRSVASADMMRCAMCGSYVSSREAIKVSGRGESQVFCSQDCMRIRLAS